MLAIARDFDCDRGSGVFDRIRDKVDGKTSQRTRFTNDVGAIHGHRLHHLKFGAQCTRIGCCKARDGVQVERFVKTRSLGRFAHKQQRVADQRR